MKHLYLSFYIIIIMTSCQKTKNIREEINTQKTSGEVTVIVKGKPSNDTIRHADGSYSKTITPNLVYANPSRPYLHRSTIANSDSGHSVKILNPDPFVIVQRKIDYDDFDFFILSPGDSVLFDYLKNEFQVLNRKVLKYDMGLGDLIHEMPMSIQELYTRNQLFRINGMLSEENKLRLKRQQAEQIQTVKSFRKDLLLKIDSVYRAEQMSKEVYDAYMTYYSFRTSTSEEVIDFYENGTPEQQDSVFKYPFTRDRLFQYYSRLGYKDVQFASGRGVFEYQIVLDSILANVNRLSEFTSDLLLYEFMGRLAQSKTSAEEVKDYFEKFKNNVNDTTLITSISANYFFDDIQINSRNTVALANNEGQKTSLSEVLSMSNDSIFYVDFWASWCAPCIAEMPASKALKADFDNQPIGFIYLSIDKDVDKWEKSSSRLGLDSNPNNYLVINGDSSQFLQDIDLTTIPRYLIIDKEGKLLQSKAPSPSTKEIRRVLESMLSSGLNQEE